MADQPTYQQELVTILDTENAHALAFLGAVGIVDNAGNRFKGRLRNDAASAMPIIEKIAPSGQSAGAWQLQHPGNVGQPRPPYKCDAFTFYPSGADLIVDSYWHGPTDGSGNRNSDKTQVVLQGVFEPPAPRSGAAGAFVGGGVSGGGDVDYGQIRQIVHDEDAADNEAAAIDQRFGSADLRTDVRELLADVFVRLADPARHDSDPKARAFQDGLRALYEGMFKDGDHGGSSIVYEQLKNTSYTGALGAIHDSGHAQGQTTQQGQGEPSK